MWWACQNRRAVKTENPESRKRKREGEPNLWAKSKTRNEGARPGLRWVGSDRIRPFKQRRRRPKKNQRKKKNRKIENTSKLSAARLPKRCGRRRRKSRNRTQQEGNWGTGEQANIFNNERCQKAIINRWHFPYWVAKVKFNNNTENGLRKTEYGIRDRGEAEGTETWGLEQHVNNENWHADINTHTCLGHVYGDGDGDGNVDVSVGVFAFCLRLRFHWGRGTLPCGMYSKNVNMLLGLSGLSCHTGAWQ